MKFHEVANIFPLMTDDELVQLANDIEQNGLQEPIWTYEGAIIDGRNRFRACEKVDVKPTYREWDGKGSLLSFVVSRNLHRRHLNESQRAMVAASIATMDRGRPSENGSIDSFSRSTAAELLNVSPKSVQRAVKIRKKGDSELAKEVESGEKTVSAATKEIDIKDKYPEIKAVVFRESDQRIIANSLDKLPEPERKEKIEKLLKHDQHVLAELANREPPVRAEVRFSDKLNKWFLDCRIRLGKLANPSFRAGVLMNWTSREVDIVVESIDLTIECLESLRRDVLGGRTYDESGEETEISGNVN